MIVDVCFASSRVVVAAGPNSGGFIRWLKIDRHAGVLRAGGWRRHQQRRGSSDIGHPRASNPHGTFERRAGQRREQLRLAFSHLMLKSTFACDIAMRTIARHALGQPEPAWFLVIRSSA